MDEIKTFVVLQVTTGVSNTHLLSTFTVSDLKEYFRSILTSEKIVNLNIKYKYQYNSTIKNHSKLIKIELKFMLRLPIFSSLNIVYHLTII